MNAIKLTEEEKVNLVSMLENLFPEYVKIEIIEENIQYVLFKEVSNTTLRGFLTNLINPKAVTCKYPLVELFIREVPRRLSIYQIGNETNAPKYWANASLLVADNPSHLIDHFKNIINKMEGAKLGDEPYRVTLARMSAVDDSIDSGENYLLNSVLKTVHPTVGQGSKMLHMLVPAKIINR